MTKPSSIAPVRPHLAQPPEQSPPTLVTRPAAISPLVLVFQGIGKHLAHWLTPEATDPTLEWTDQCSPKALETAARINAQGLDIIRRFEKFLPDTELTIREAEQAVLRQVTVPLSSNQFSALVSFTHSLGEANLRRSTLLRHLNAGRYRAAANEFDRWVYVGSHRLSALIARRVAEKGLFLKG
ncbi:MAG: lysozyme [Synechococcales cyanobacterium C42_A2020_086]|nr:lysozyme [Synechococcales cyanobacterium M58_A2018_015]MBF2072170.1 lysozyme [Synechococcales cyanobacterium C42_A2020_086]